jgi:hypothetical protein
MWKVSFLFAMRDEKIFACLPNMWVRPYCLSMFRDHSRDYILAVSEPLVGFTMSDQSLLSPWRYVKQSPLPTRGGMSM